METAGYDPGIGETPDTDMIYIQNLPLDVTEADIVAHFGSIGVIKFDKKQVHSIAAKANSFPTPAPTCQTWMPPDNSAWRAWHFSRASHNSDRLAFRSIGQAQGLAVPRQGHWPAEG